MSVGRIYFDSATGSSPADLAAALDLKDVRRSRRNGGLRRALPAKDGSVDALAFKLVRLDGRELVLCEVGLRRALSASANVTLTKSIGEEDVFWTPMRMVELRAGRRVSDLQRTRVTRTRWKGRTTRRRRA